MNEPKVVNSRIEAYDVYIGRPGKWGNPYKIGKDGSREEVIVKYEDYLVHSSLLLDIDELTNKVLGCWCKPLPCHGDVLLKLANPGKKLNDDNGAIVARLRDDRGWYSNEPFSNI